MTLSKIRAALDAGDVFHAWPVGKNFAFTAEHGSHRHELLGTVTGVMWSDEGGIKLFVSIPEFWGRPLKCLTHTEKGWCAYIDVDDNTMQRELDRLPEYSDDTTEQAIIDRYIANKFIAGELKVLES
jgi:hypothetical protein